jgi:rhodanese-related sulfurtransferase
VLINVHIPDEGSLPGTELSLPYNEIDDRAADLPADKATPLAIYCMSGNMSATAGRDLLDLGYADVVELDGGMRAWQSSGRTLLPAGS